MTATTGTPSVAGRRARRGARTTTGRPTIAIPGGKGIGYLLLTALAYIPVMLTAPGKVAADTKQYLYLDPGRLLERAWSMWDPNIGMGTVTHQNIGYLFPMGPFYWALDRVGLPDWVSQRLWLGSILLFAGLGMLYLFRTIGVRGPGAVVGTLAFMLSPYLLDYAARISVILLPWAGLAWLLAFTVRALRQGGWKYPALIALTVQVIGSVNATALVFVGIAPVVWVPYAIWVLHEVSWRRGLATVGRIAVLSITASLWWISGLWAQGAYGIDILKYTETLKAVSRTSLPNEVLRGLGYWFFYGRDKLGSWIEASPNYTQWPTLILLSYGIPVLALISAAFLRWRHRAYFVVITVIGVIVAVGAHPYDSPTPVGGAFKELANGSTVAFALRSTGRATPLVVLGLAALLGAGVNAFWSWCTARGWEWQGLLAAALVGALVILNLPALWNGTFYGENLQRPEAIPQYWKDAAAYLNQGSPGTRVLELPGADFASYRWGNTVDPITPGLMDRPYVARELIPYGSPASANLLNALDLRIQSRQLPAGAVAPLVRLMGVGSIAERNDIQFERYRVLRPEFVSQLLTPTPDGLGPRTTFGKPSAAGTTLYPFQDEQALGSPTPLVTPPPVVIYGVKDPIPIVRAKGPQGSVVIAGDGDGVVDAGAARLLENDPLVLYSAAFADDPAALRTQLGAGATLVVTDSNRDRARRWSTVTDTVGYTEGPGSHPLEKDPADARLDLFPDAPANAYTTTRLDGVKALGASAYANPITYTPEDRPARAFDGDPFTAWRVGAFDDVQGDHLRVTLDHPITTDHVNLVQALVAPNERYITSLKLQFDGDESQTVSLDRSSRTVKGQTVNFGRRRFQTLDLEIRDTNLGQPLSYSGVSPVGFGEIRLKGDAPGARPIRVREVVQMPTDLLDTAGKSLLQQPLVLLMQRERVIPVPPRTDPEVAMAREFRLPTARTFALEGAARLSPTVPDDQIDRLLGYTGPVVATSSAHLAGAPQDRASAALDGNPSTAWVTPFTSVVDQYIDVALPAPTTLSSLDLQLVADGRHSVPTKLTISNESGDTREVDLPAVQDQAALDASVPAPVQFPAITGQKLRVTIAAIREATTHEWYCECDLVMPAGIAELGIAGVAPIQVPAEIPQQCRSDLIQIDGKPVPVRVAGSTADALALSPLRVQACTGVGLPATTTLGTGTHVLKTQQGNRHGFDVDTVSLSSQAGGQPWIRTTGLASGTTNADAAAPTNPAGTDVGAASPSSEQSGPTPKMRVVENGRSSVRAHVTGLEQPTWLTLGQSVNPGWRATVNGRDIGESRLVDGYANGWFVQPTKDGVADVTFTWVPQQTVNRALAISVVAVILCIALAFVSGMRRRRRIAGGLVLADTSAALDVAPEIGSPLVAAGTASWWRTTAAVVLAGLLGALAVTPWVGVLLAVAVLIVMLRPRWRALLTLVPVLGLMACGAYIALRQWHGHLPATFEWPTFFSPIRTLGWIVVVFLAGDAIVELVRRRRAPK